MEWVQGLGLKKEVWLELEVWVVMGSQAVALLIVEAEMEARGRSLLPL
jgi:hypothetical protein